MLGTAIEHLSNAKTSASEILEIIERIRVSFPKMQKIWKHSQAALAGAHEKLENWIEAGEQLKASIAAGTMKLDDPVMAQVS